MRSKRVYKYIERPGKRVTTILGLPVASVVALPVVSSPPLPAVFFEPAHMPYTHGHSYHVIIFRRVELTQ